MNAPAVVAVVAAAPVATGGAPLTPTATDMMRIASALLKSIFIYILLSKLDLIGQLRNRGILLMSGLNRTEGGASGIGFPSSRKACRTSPKNFSEKALPKKAFRLDSFAMVEIVRLNVKKPAISFLHV
jgi:hypothetical protein